MNPSRRNKLTNPHAIVFGLLPRETQTAMIEASQNHLTQCLTPEGWATISPVTWQPHLAYRIVIRNYKTVMNSHEGRVFGALSPAEQEEIKRAALHGRSVQVFTDQETWVTTSSWTDNQAVRLAPERAVTKCMITNQQQFLKACPVTVNRTAYGDSIPMHSHFAGFQYGDHMQKELQIKQDITGYIQIKIPDAICFHTPKTKRRKPVIQ